MVIPIKKDHDRFRQITRGVIRKELHKYISRGELIGKQGGDLISIPLPSIQLPRFIRGKNSPGVSSGDGKPGTPLGSGDGSQMGAGAGSASGEHILEVDVPLEELFKILGEELELPKIEPRGKHDISKDKDIYSGARRVGPWSLRLKRKMLKEAKKRTPLFGNLQEFLAYIRSLARHPLQHIITIDPSRDKRIRSWKTVKELIAAAVIIYMMDVSGSMEDDQKEIVRIMCWWMEGWINLNFPGVRTHYIVHDAQAAEVDKHTFYHTRESGGTRISSALRLCKKLVAELPGGVADWNVYGFHFSDGDNWGEDNAVCMEIIKEILPQFNRFGYCQVESPYGSGQFLKELNGAFAKHETLKTFEVKDKDQIENGIKTFLGKRS